MKKRNYLMCVLLTILTLGLYGFYWLVQITDTVNELAKPDKKTSGIKSLLFELLTCGIYIYFWSWKIGIVLDQERSKAGLPPKNLKLLFLILAFFAWPVSMALMQKEINEIGGIPEKNASLYDVQQNTSNRIMRWIISIAGTFASLLFLLVSQILKLGFVQKKGMGKGVGYGITLWIKDTFTYNPFSFSLILTGICILVISCLFLGPCYGRKKSSVVSIVAMIAMILLSVSLFINGIYYKPFYSEFRFLSSLFICNIVMISSMLVAGLSAAVFCSIEFMISISINKLRSVFLAATTAFFWNYNSGYYRYSIAPTQNLCSAWLFISFWIPIPVACNIAAFRMHKEKLLNPFRLFLVHTLNHFCPMVHPCLVCFYIIHRKKRFEQVAFRLQKL